MALLFSHYNGYAPGVFSWVVSFGENGHHLRSENGKFATIIMGLLEWDMIPMDGDGSVRVCVIRLLRV